MPHNFTEDPLDYSGRCVFCGERYHCGQCNEGTSMMGHQTKDDLGYFFYCQEPERYAVKRALDAAKAKLIRRAQYEKLKKEFES